MIRALLYAPEVGDIVIIGFGLLVHYEDVERVLLPQAARRECVVLVRIEGCRDGQRAILDYEDQVDVRGFVLRRDEAPVDDQEARERECSNLIDQRLQLGKQVEAAVGLLKAAEQLTDLIKREAVFSRLKEAMVVQ